MSNTTHVDISRMRRTDPIEIIENNNLFLLICFENVKREMQWGAIQ